MATHEGQYHDPITFRVVDHQRIEVTLRSPLGTTYKRFIYPFEARAIRDALTLAIKRAEGYFRPRVS